MHNHIIIDGVQYITREEHEHQMRIADELLEFEENKHNIIVNNLEKSIIDSLAKRIKLEIEGLEIIMQQSKEEHIQLKLERRIGNIKRALMKL